MKKEIQNYIRAGYAGLYVVSHEEQRAEREIMNAVSSLKGFKLHEWSVTKGIISIDGDSTCTIEETNDPQAMLEKLSTMPEKTVLIARDLHMFLDNAPALIRLIKDVIMLGKNANIVLIILGCRYALPPELEKEFTKVDFTLPDRDQLGEMLQAISKSASIELNGETEKIVDAACGLTTIEAENAFALSIVETKTVSASVVFREKCNEIKKNGILEIVDLKVTLDDIGGLENLKEDLQSKRNLFTKAAREYGISSPRGMLIVGQPGTGKSLTATATQAIFNLPLIKLNASSLFAKHVGESEGNWRNAFATVKANAPCILWIDEVDGLTSGSKSSGETDGGTTARVVKQILHDMQFNSEGIFYVLTANDIDGLPDPLIDRMDVWSVDLPTHAERMVIWKIHTVKMRTGECTVKRDWRKFDCDSLALLSDGFSGRQIEQAWLAAMVKGFNAGREVRNSDCVEVLGKFVPTSKTMAGQIEARRLRLQNRAMPAGKVQEKSKVTCRKVVSN